MFHFHPLIAGISLRNVTYRRPEEALFASDAVSSTWSGSALPCHLNTWGILLALRCMDSPEVLQPFFLCEPPEQASPEWGTKEQRHEHIWKTDNSWSEIRIDSPSLQLFSTWTNWCLGQVRLFITLFCVSVAFSLIINHPAAMRYYRPLAWCQISTFHVVIPRPVHSTLSTPRLHYKREFASK